MPPIAIVLGASGAIGAAIAKRLALRTNLILHGSTPSDRLMALASQTGGAIRTADLTDETETDSLFQGLDGLDILVFSVGRSFPHRLSHRTGWEVFQSQLDSQLKALHLTLSRAFPLLKERNGGARVLVVSSEYILGTPPTKVAPYIAAKAAMTSYTRVVAQEWVRYGIYVHIIAPGLVRSALTAELPEEYLSQLAEGMPEKRLTNELEVAELADSLLAPASDCLYGTVLQASRGARRC